MATEARDTDKDWERIASEEPYWGVLSDDDYRGKAIGPDAMARFKATGEEFVANVFALVEKHLQKGFKPTRALDVGCGVGRLLIPIAKRVREAVGVDVAPTMLKLCEKNAAGAGISNIRTFVGDDDLTRVDGLFGFVNSYIVLQHVPPLRGYQLIQAMLDRLAIGGIGSIQMTYAKERKFLVHEAPKASLYRREGGMIVDLLSTVAKPPEGTISMFDYDLNEVVARVARVCGHPLITLPTNNEGHIGVHLIFKKAR